MIFHAVTKFLQLSQCGKYTVRWELTETPAGERWTTAASYQGAVICTFVQEQGGEEADAQARAACLQHQQRIRPVAA